MVGVGLGVVLSVVLEGVSRVALEAGWVSCMGFSGGSMALWRVCASVAWLAMAGRDVVLGEGVLESYYLDF